MMIMMTLVFGLIVLDIYNILNCVYQTIVDIYMINIYHWWYIYAFLPLEHMYITTCGEACICRTLYNPGVKNVKRKKLGTWYVYLYNVCICIHSYIKPFCKTNFKLNFVFIFFHLYSIPPPLSKYCR